MNVRRACTAATLCFSLLGTAGTAALAQDQPSLTSTAPEHVLMIGNSHTGRNGGLDWLVENFVAAAGDDSGFDAQAHTKGGVTLAYHWQNGAPAIIRTGAFDTVVLQGWLTGEQTHSIAPFVEYAKLLDGIVREAGANTIFFMTWPRADGDWSDLGDAIEAHRIVAAETGAHVAPAALAFELAQAERPELALIGEDGVHATWAGAYLAAATVYATLFDRSPEGSDFHFWIAPDDAAFLQRIAWDAVTEWQELTATERLIAVTD